MRQNHFERLIIFISGPLGLTVAIPIVCWDTSDKVLRYVPNKWAGDENIFSVNIHWQSAPQWCYAARNATSARRLALVLQSR